MSTRHSFLISICILLVCTLTLLIIFGDRGLADLNLLKQERDRLVEKNALISQDNLALYREMERLKNDLKYIEDIARRDLGMIGKQEYILKIKQ